MTRWPVAGSLHAGVMRPGSPLPRARQEHAWPTPRAWEHINTGILGSDTFNRRLARGYLANVVVNCEAAHCVLNAARVPTLMGWPVGWVEA